MKRRENVTACSRTMTQRDRPLQIAAETHFCKFGRRISPSAGGQEVGGACRMHGKVKKLTYTILVANLEGQCDRSSAEVSALD